jgi:ubiquinone/menaquinone biosynthesis C-methylase UbiE
VTSDAVAAFYDEWTDRFVAGFGTTFQAGLLTAPGAREDVDASNVELGRRAGIRPGDRVLDAGCGVGGPARAIARWLQPAQVVGLTISPVQAARARGVLAGVPAAQVVCADYHAVPASSDRFDVTLFLESCGYSADRDALFAEAVRVTRPGGSIYVKDVFVRPGPMSDAERAGLSQFDRTWRLATSPTFDGVVDSLERAGCDVVRCAPLDDVGTTTFLAAMVEPDPDTLLRLNELGRTFGLAGQSAPLVFGEALARVP